MDLILDDDLSPELRKILEETKDAVAATIRPCVKFTLQPQPTLDVWRSKVGGVPYLPKNVEYPRSPTGRELQFLVQINFAEVPRLPKFPKTGILQFYIGDEGLYGKDIDAFKVLYFPDFTRDKELLVRDFSFLPEFEYGPLDHRSSPAAMHFEKKYLPASTSGWEFPWEPWEALKAIEDTQLFVELLLEYSIKVSQESGHKIGGYPSFIQEDWRWGDGRYYRLLLQLGSEDVKGENDCSLSLVWGDYGIGRFFITDEDLLNLNFSNVTYDWDCT